MAVFRRNAKRLSKNSFYREVGMNFFRFLGSLVSALLLGSSLLFSGLVYAQSIQSETLAPELPDFSEAIISPESPPVTSESKAQTFATVLDGATKIDGLIPLYRNGSHVYAALRKSDFDTDLIVLISIARGIAQRPLFAGATWGFGDDWVCQFRRAGQRVHFVRRNVRYRAQEGSPSARAVELAYSDSILASLPIAAERTDGTVLIDISPVFMSDLPHITQSLPGFEYSPERSSWANVNGYADNIELQVAATYTSEGAVQIESVPDARAVTIHVHYSISRLPQTNYRPRLADDRIGYFLSVVKDYSRQTDEDRFVRYINRWQLEKQDPTQELSPPKEPIVFWIEKTVPYKYREPIRAGILEWNKAFAKIGFKNAIEVRQQPDDANWQPGDVRYNTFRWITAGTSVAMGPSRVNPTTGQILDADIVFDADYLQTWKRKYEYFTPEGVALLTGGSLDLASYHRQQADFASGHTHECGGFCACQIMSGMSHELALSATVLARTTRSHEEIQKLTMQGVRKVAMHEVGHTLGLRHNFKGSTLYSVDEAYRQSLREGPVALSASVMDYLPAQLAAPGDRQGTYYTSTIGPYDYWAVEYGYRPIDVETPQEEKPQLNAIAARSGEPGHAYATDEDTRGVDSDPLSGAFDYGNDLIEHAEKQADIVAHSWTNLVERVTNEGEGYQHARQAFGVLMATHCRAMFAASRYVGGVYSTRSHRGDANARPPYQVVDAETQRRALDLLSRRMFSDEAFNLPAELYNQLAVTYWNHWGSQIPSRTDFPVHDSILVWQDRVLEKLLSSLTLTRLHDSELLVPADQDAFTVAELLQRLTDSIYAEVWSTEAAHYTNRQPAISSLRRNLQQAYLARITRIALDQEETPSDCQTVATLQLSRLSRDISKLLASDVQLDIYSQAHLAETAVRIEKVLAAQYVQTQ